MVVLGPLAVMGGRSAMIRRGRGIAALRLAGDVVAGDSFRIRVDIMMMLLMLRGVIGHQVAIGAPCGGIRVARTPPLVGGGGEVVRGLRVARHGIIL